VPDLNWFAIFRWLHILAGAAWLGEVAAVVFILVPAVRRLPAADRVGFMIAVFPRMFKLASVLAFVALAAGAALNYLLTGWRDLGAYFATPHGQLIALGGGLGLLLGLFHFTAERKLEPAVTGLAARSHKDLERTLKFLTIVPRIGLAILVIVFVSMMLAARGF
jgi:hypothetical protein